jgi:hypothetical protein
MEGCLGTIRRHNRLSTSRKRIPAAILVLVLGVTLCLPALAEAFRLTLAWDPNTETDLAGYKIYIGYAPKKYSWIVDVGNRTTGTVDNLVDGSVYYFTLTAYNSKGLESGFSNEIRFPPWKYNAYFPLVTAGPQ